MFRKLLLLIVLMPLGLMAQKSIKWNGLPLNNLDKQNRKQGEWLFFDKQGNALMECRFHNDKIEGPRIFFHNGDTSLIRFEPVDSLEHFVYYFRKEPLGGVFVNTGNQVRIELEKIPEGFTGEDIQELKRLYATKISPVYMFGTRQLAEYFSAAYNKYNTIPNWNHNFVLTINASGKVTHVEREEKDEIWTASLEREVYDMIYSMGRWQPFFDTWQTREIKITMSLGADLQIISAR